MSFRDIFHTPRAPYFQSHSAGCRPKGSDEFLYKHYTQPWQEQPGETWAIWLPEIDRFRETLARLINTHSDNLCPQTNLSSGLSKILYSLPDIKGRHKILMSKQDFPSIGFVVQQASRRGWDVEFLPDQSDYTDIEVWRAAIDSQTRIVIATHIQSNNSRKAPVKEICRIAKENNATSIIDVAQSAGCTPIDVADWQADFLIGSSLKFLCGGPGAGWLYAAPEAAALCLPIDTGWFSHENPFEFDIENFRYHKGALRFWGGTPDVQPFIQAAYSIERLLGIGIANIEQHIQNLLSLAIANLPAESIGSETRAGHRGSMLTIRHTPSMLDALQAAHIACDQRLDITRFSFHIYNSENELDKILHICKAG
ncbi:MAG: aminotransferase class V-fold PLP-dependent enzyme [bacterium]